MIMTTLLFKVLNNNLDNDFVIYALCIGVVGAIGYSLTSKILFLNTKTNTKTYVDTGVQTDAVEDDTDNLSDCSTETITPLSYKFGDRSTLISSSSTSTSDVGTQTIAENVISNPENIGRVIDLSNAEYIAAKVDELNTIDPFGATPWTSERVYDLIDTLGIVNNLFN